MKLNLVILLAIAALVLLALLRCGRNSENFVGAAPQNNQEMCMTGCYSLYAGMVSDASKRCNSQYPDDANKAMQCFKNSKEVQAQTNCSSSCAKGCDSKGVSNNVLGDPYKLHHRLPMDPDQICGDITGPPFTYPHKC